MSGKSHREVRMAVEGFAEVLKAKQPDCKHLFAISTGIQCTVHCVDRHDYEDECEWEEAQAAICVKCYACEKCEAPE